MGFIEGVKNKILESRYYNTLRFNFFTNFVIELTEGLTRKNVSYYSQFLKRNDGLVFDVGANKGHKTNAFHKMGFRIVAVDPELKSIETIRYRFRRYKNISIENLALGKTPGQMKLYITASRSGLNTLSKDWVTDKKEEVYHSSYWVDVTTLDLLIQKYGKPYFLKIDVEGYESEVLSGLGHAIPVICFEANLPTFTKETIDCIDILGKLDDYLFSIGVNDKLQSDWMTADAIKLKILNDNYSCVDIIAQLSSL